MALWNLDPTKSEDPDKMELLLKHVSDGIALP